MSIVHIDTPGGAIFVEVSEEQQVSVVLPVPGKPAQRKDAEPVSALPSTVETYKALQSLLSGLSNLVKQQIQELSPDECSLEAKIGFAGKINPLPFLVSAKNDANLSLTLKWKRKSTD
jgi:hypothetical protein